MSTYSKKYRTYFYTMDLPYNTTFNIGDHLILELNTNEIFEGDYSDGGKNRIELINTRQHNNTNQLGGSILLL
ncbi:hypothetical protein NQ314_021395 [Rhamnusium bicolor]|uniref:Uncharacterized protein n=1 Tax=Rhamnusium bicolor TaxID=1586634 RepID=A0AAV8WKC5_9CUCU|nr:hypothetical protein NQ314_021395 [Rhamnusium bicolor]